jgi:Family of unknown function (DUF6445)
MIPVTVHNNFFEDPDAVRKFALQLNYSKSGGYIPGVRTDFLHQIDKEFYKEFSTKLFSLFFDIGIHKFGVEMISQFQLISGYYEEGWVHDDVDSNQWNIAGVVYLSPNAPLDSGTIIYDAPESVVIDPMQKEYKEKFYNHEPVDIAHLRKIRNLHNAKFKESITVNNVYNRLVVYNSNQLHRAYKYFGNDATDSRLTLVFFAKIGMATGTASPTQRAQKVPI